MPLDTQTSRWAVLAVVNIPLYLGLGSIFFGDLAGFIDCLQFWFTSDWISLFNGEYFEDRWSEAKLFLFAILCAGALYGEYNFFFGDPFSKPLPSVSRLTPRSSGPDSHGLLISLHAFVYPFPIHHSAGYPAA
jgi:hypothetical protein